MKTAWFVLRSVLLWIASGLHFFLAVPVLVFLGIFLDARKHDSLQRGLCRRIAFLSGAKVEVRRSQTPLKKRFGNVPVPNIRRPSDLKRMWRLTLEAINTGTSLVIFPEAKRTR